MSRLFQIDYNIKGGPIGPAPVNRTAFQSGGSHLVEFQLVESQLVKFQLVECQLEEFDSVRPNS